MKSFSQLRRRYFKAVAGSFIIASTPSALAFPDKPIRLIVPSAAGGSPDILCRLIAVEMATQLGVNIVVDNKPGAGGAIGIQDLVRATPDGTTIGYGNIVTLAINQSLYKALNYDADKQLAPIGLIGFVQNVLVVAAGSPHKTMADLVAYGKASPGRLNMASSGSGTTSHLGGELFAMMAGFDIVHVPYKGSPQALADVMSGQADFMFDNTPSAMPHITAGKLRALAVSGAKRSPVLPDTPTVAELGIMGYETVAWGGLVAPAGTPAPIIEKLNAELNRALHKPLVAERLARMGFEPAPGPAVALRERAQQERSVWARVVQKTGATPN